MGAPDTQETLRNLDESRHPGLTATGPAGVANRQLPYLWGFAGQRAAWHGREWGLHPLSPMQIHEDQETAQEPEPKKRRDTSPMLRLMRRHVEEETLRLPLSALSFWRDPIDPELETIQVRLNLPENTDDEETLVGPLTI
jgi:hypothetical protein